jgi:tetratricopeptide (TPR) repeat protein
MLAGARSVLFPFFLLAFLAACALPVPAQLSDVSLETPRKVIQDPAECRAYRGASQQKSASAKCGSLEAFLAQYPDSVMKEDALELLLVAYREAGSPARTIETAQRLLQLNPCNLRALAVMASSEEGGLPEAEKGLQCLQTVGEPVGVPGDAWRKQKAQMNEIFSGKIGREAFQSRNIRKAERHLLSAVQSAPNDPVNVYYLALAYLTPGPDGKIVDGLFFIARAAILQQGASRDQIARYGKSQYIKYHGSEEDWNDLLAVAASAPTPPAHFTIARRETPSSADEAGMPFRNTRSKDVSKDVNIAERNAVVVNRRTNHPRRGAPSLGQNKQVNPYVWGGCCFVFAIVEPESPSDTVPYAPAAADMDNDYVIDADYTSTPPDSNLAADDTDAADRATDHDSPLVAADFGHPASDAPPVDPVTAQPSTVLVFKDGRQTDVLNYAIAGETLFDFDDGRTRKILLVDLDLPATHKANDDRGVDFQIPSAH